MVALTIISILKNETTKQEKLDLSEFCLEFYVQIYAKW